MSLRSIKTAIVFSALILGIFGLSGNLSGARGLPVSEGILNFGKVTDTLYRGAQPDVAGFDNLQRLGVKSVINLRMAGDAWKDELVTASAHGILYTNVPLPGFSRPNKADVDTILSLIDSMPGPVFIHCQHGCDRTGTIVACYRMRHDHWTLQKSLAEANQYGLSFFERGMKRFIAQFSKFLVQVQKAA